MFKFLLEILEKGLSFESAGNYKNSSQKLILRTVESTQFLLEMGWTSKKTQFLQLCMWDTVTLGEHVCWRVKLWMVEVKVCCTFKIFCTGHSKPLIFISVNQHEYEFEKCRKGRRTKETIPRVAFCKLLFAYFLKRHHWMPKIWVLICLQKKPC